jgi:hypothetical protein
MTNFFLFFHFKSLVQCILKKNFKFKKIKRKKSKIISRPGCQKKLKKIRVLMNADSENIKQILKECSGKKLF